MACQSGAGSGATGPAGGGAGGASGRASGERYKEVSKEHDVRKTNIIAGAWGCVCALWLVVAGGMAVLGAGVCGGGFEQARLPGPAPAQPPPSLHPSLCPVTLLTSCHVGAAAQELVGAVGQWGARGWGGGGRRGAALATVHAHKG